MKAISTGSSQLAPSAAGAFPTSRSSCSDTQSSVAIGISQGFQLCRFSCSKMAATCPSNSTSGHAVNISTLDIAKGSNLRPVEIWSSPVVWVFLSFYRPLCVDCHQVGKGQIFEVHSFEPIAGSHKHRTVPMKDTYTWDILRTAL